MGTMRGGGRGGGTALYDAASGVRRGLDMDMELEKPALKGPRVMPKGRRASS